MTTFLGHNRGIPTRYRGHQYRSRLEARWACFFDLLGWHYEYEPCDFEGWIPDFVLCEAKPVFVEVKPVTKFPEDVGAKIDSTTCPHEALIVGMSLGVEVGRDFHPFLGWLRQGPHDDHEGAWYWDWSGAPFGIWTPPSPYELPRIGFCHENGSFHDRITGRYDGGCWGEHALDRNSLLETWAEAGNVTQWRGGNAARAARFEHGETSQGFPHV